MWLTLWTYVEFTLDRVLGDFDGDNDVDGADFLRWQQAALSADDSGRLAAKLRHRQRYSWCRRRARAGDFGTLVFNNCSFGASSGSMESARYGAHFSPAGSRHFATR